MPKILVIDDKKDNLIAASALLKNLISDCTAITAQSGAEGIKKAQTELPDTILLDIKMPEMDGFEVCRALKNDENTARIPIIILTAIKTDSKSRVKALETGADAFLTKPIEETELVAQVNTALRIKKAEDVLRKEKDLLEVLVQERTKALLESEQRFSLTLKDSKITAFNQDKDLRYTWVYNPNPGLSIDDVIGRTDEDLIPSKDAEVLTAMKRSVLETGIGECGIIRFTVGGQPSFYDISIEPMCDDAGDIIGVMGSSTEITELKLTEEALKASLKEKEVLLSEIHHRVKNNMQVIISLLKLQADKIEDKKYANMLQESQNRILSMALVHEQLYLSKDFANIDFGEYVKSFVNGLFVSYGVDTNKVKLNIDIKDVSFDLENAIPCGLIINELASNSLKHAFPRQGEGNISIVLRATNEDDLELTVSDDGVGIPEDLDVRDTESMGLHLVRVLAEQTLEGKMELNRTEGTKFHFILKRSKYKPRI